MLYRMNMSYENNGAPHGSFVDNTRQDSIFIAPVLKWNIDASTWVKLEAQYNSTTTGQYFRLRPSTQRRSRKHPAQLELCRELA